MAEQRVYDEAAGGALVSTTPPTIEDANAEAIRAQAQAAMAANRTYLAIASPSAAQTTAQVKALTRQVQALIRLALGQLDGTD